MPETVIYAPFPRALYDDIVRFSDGEVDPVEMAVQQLYDLMERSADDVLFDWFGERAVEFAAIYFPELLEEWEKRDAARVEESLARIKPLIWKAVSVPAGSEVRMQYDGVHHFAKVANGKIHDDDGGYSPSEWASNVAAGTSRNAWRDLWFKFPASAIWVSAISLREKAKEI